MLRDGEFTQITKDDTHVQILVDGAGSRRKRRPSIRSDR